MESHMIAKVSRSIFLALGMLAITTYVLLAVVFLWSGLRQLELSGDDSLFVAWAIIDYVIFVPGLPPLILAIYFWLLEKSTKANSIGALLVSVFCLIHFYVAGVTAHNEWAVFLPLQATELVGAIGIVLVWKKWWKGEGGN